MENNPHFTATGLSVPYLEEMAEVLRVLGHSYRLQIIEYLDLHGSSPVYAIAEALGGTQGALSQHLGKMRSAGLLDSERRGKEVWYKIINSDALTILNCVRTRCAKKKAEKARSTP